MTRAEVVESLGIVAIYHALHKKKELVERIAIASLETGMGGKAFTADELFLIITPNDLAECVPLPDIFDKVFRKVALEFGWEEPTTKHEGHSNAPAAEETPKIPGVVVKDTGSAPPPPLIPPPRPPSISPVEPAARTMVPTPPAAAVPQPEFGEAPRDSWPNS